ncbi:unnamed protein product, partial [Vitis vinifera]
MTKLPSIHDEFHVMRIGISVNFKKAGTQLVSIFAFSRLQLSLSRKSFFQSSGYYEASVHACLKYQ